MKLPKLIPDSLPRFYRIIIVVFFSLFELIGVAFSLRSLAVSGKAFLLSFTAFLVLGVTGVLILSYAWLGFTNLARRKTFQKVEQFYRQRGYCTEMCDAIKSIMPQPTKRDNVLLVYLLTRCERYEEAKRVMLDINQPSLLRREFAMLMTAKLRLYMMTACIEKFEHILDNHKAELDSIYEMQRELNGVYTDYADDSYDYFMLLAAYLQILGRQDEAAEYNKKAAFQASNRNEAEMECYTRLLELNGLYAAGKTEAAHTLEQELYVLPDTFSPPMTQPQKTMFRTALEQAKIFSSHADIAEKAMLLERNLPPQNASNDALLQFGTPM